MTNVMCAAARMPVSTVRACPTGMPNMTVAMCARAMMHVSTARMCHSVALSSIRTVCAEAMAGATEPQILASDTTTAECAADSTAARTANSRSGVRASETCVAYVRVMTRHAPDATVLRIQMRSMTNVVTAVVMVRAVLQRSRRHSHPSTRSHLKSHPPGNQPAAPPSTRQWCHCRRARRGPQLHTCRRSSH